MATKSRLLASSELTDGRTDGQEDKLICRATSRKAGSL
jgi:hypothetical protein